MTDQKDRFQKTNTSREETGPDLFSAAIIFIGINLMWIFFALWVLFGMIPVLLLAVFLNHLINRLEIRQKHQQV